MMPSEDSIWTWLDMAIAAEQKATAIGYMMDTLDDASSDLRTRLSKRKREVEATARACIARAEQQIKLKAKYEAGGK